MNYRHARQAIPPALSILLFDRPDCMNLIDHPTHEFGNLRAAARDDALSRQALHAAENEGWNPRPSSRARNRRSVPVCRLRARRMSLT
jgi:hypothetical protein